MDDLALLKDKLDQFIIDIDPLNDSKVIPFKEILKGLSKAVDTEIKKEDLICTIISTN